MKRTKIIDIAHIESAGGDILIRGWIRTKRDSKAFSFMNVNDGSNLGGIQVVMDAVLENYENLKRLTTGASVEVEGKLVASPGKNQSYEIQASRVHIYGFADPETYPIQKKKMTLEYLREYSHLRPRTNTYSAVFRMRDSIAFATHEFFRTRGFRYVHTPIITGADTEGAGEMFRVTTLDLAKVPKTKDGAVDTSQDFFGKEVNLTVSGQLAVENFCSAIGDVYTFGPTFRAENSNTTRHLSEFWMIEPEIAFADLDDDMDLAEDYIKYLINFCLKNHQEDLEFLNKMYDNSLLERLNHVAENRFARVTYTDAIDILKRANKPFEFKPEWGMDLQTEHERFLCEEHFKLPTIVYNYPKDIKAFYMKLNDDGKTVAAMDVLCAGIGEIIGGSQREEDHDRLLNRMTEMGMDIEEYQWYLDLRKYGTHPHAGFGLGFERAVQYITGMQNIRDVIPFPRYPKHAEF
jgi:asparaginyl-tRNA synthetase